LSIEKGEEMQEKEINRILEEHRQLADEFVNILRNGKSKYTVAELKQKLKESNKEVKRVKAYLKDEKKKQNQERRTGDHGKAQRNL
jgi:hypothetical protein